MTLKCGVLTRVMDRWTVRPITPVTRNGCTMLSLCRMLLAVTPTFTKTKKQLSYSTQLLDIRQVNVALLPFKNSEETRARRALTIMNVRMVK